MESLSIIAVVVVGLMVGVELSVAFVMNPIFDRLPRDAGIAARSDGARMLGRVMPFWYIGSVLLVAGTALSEPATAGPAWAAVALLLVSVVMSVALLVPINNRSKAWTPETAPADWRDQRSRWDRLHLVRLALIINAFVLVTVAATR
ncbi:uncharacterized protein DUF1772 [Isoptericola sp. CG 20/1183]|uniref:Uncharacterized protein DUF1772 n=1 Tax=Isoptericola halotolerans TaxID=300560 RepID=A0ABX5EG90_9MICO|nr:MULTISPECIES: DUF1772 domain-containing protein [Isoptericola]PRZ08363.1 uncharacterized protein DUF1772 [Isoptericola halotolerans]PRZ09160.1 uncharacterized protein DUF1772 [Isoptericola sp. CG 20/1183]